jgi:hypothetical protein
MKCPSTSSEHKIISSPTAAQDHAKRSQLKITSQ